MKRILISDLTKQAFQTTIPETDCIILDNAENPDLFKNYDIIWLTAQIPDMSESLVYAFDYINGSGKNPLMGKNRDDLGLRFPDMSYVFKKIIHKEIPPVIITAGDIKCPDNQIKYIRCDLLVWNAILAAHQKKIVYGLFYREKKEAERLIAVEMKD